MAQKGGCGQKEGSREERPMVFRDAAASFRYGVKGKALAVRSTRVEILLLDAKLASIGYRRAVQPIRGLRSKTSGGIATTVDLRRRQDV
jgi:hypothetical protein